MQKMTLRTTFCDLVNELFGEYRETEEIIGDRGILTQLNVRYTSKGVCMIDSPPLALQQISIRA